MKYRSFGSTGFQVSALGFGCMRLPTKGDPAAIDEGLAMRMLAYAVDHGVNYFDTAYGYHAGESERFLGRFLENGHRQRVKVATKLPCSRVEVREDMDRILNEQLEKLRVEHIDFYLLHGLRKERWEQMLSFDVLSWLERAQADGRIGYLGFSFHDSTAVLKEILDAYEGWDFCQIQYNFMNEGYQAGTEGLRYAASKGLGVVVMEPLLGGWLVDPPEPIQRIWDRASVRRTPAEWGLQWVWNHPEVSVALSGMSSMQQVEENVASAERSGVHTLTAEELDIVARVRDTYKALCPIPCTGCRYCMPCPNGVDIPRVFDGLNRGVMYGNLEEARRRYLRMEEGQRASACMACRLCEAECPQGIPISEWMPFVHRVLGEGMSYDPEACPA
ncbi:MAG: aldo/keto reductase [Chloroflexi bacterium]|nr:aldo/keto reductase [Chloroflexota bacterium]